MLLNLEVATNTERKRHQNIESLKNKLESYHGLRQNRKRTAPIKKG